MVDEEIIRRRFRLIEGHLDERLRRLLAAAEAKTVGFGGASVVARATGVSRRAIRAGVRELQQAPQNREPGRRVRRPGGGRKKTVAQDPTLERDLEKLIEPVTRGDPESPLRWTCKSVRRLAEELKRRGHATSHRMVAELLHEMGYSLQANVKTMEGTNHPDRNAQFEHINKRVRQYLRKGNPVISVDTKKKELVGEFKNGGQELRPKGMPEKVRVHDFVIPELGRAIPYGVCERGDGPRHGGVCGGDDPPVVEMDGEKTPSRSAAAFDHRRCRGKQRISTPSVEDGNTEAGGPDANPGYDLSFPSRNKQAQQNRAPALFLYQPELAGEAARQPRDNRQTDRRDPNKNRA